MNGNQSKYDEYEYYYSAGKISDYISSHNDFYYLTIIFNENWKVKSAYIKMSD